MPRTQTSHPPLPRLHGACRAVAAATALAACAQGAAHAQGFRAADSACPGLSCFDGIGAPTEPSPFDGTETFTADAGGVLASTDGSLPGSAAFAARQSLTVAAGVPLRLRVTQTSSLRPGSAVTAVLQEPVYVRDQLALSAGTVLHGTVASTEQASRMVRAKAWLNGDVTPQRLPVVSFTSFDGEHGAMPLSAEARVRMTQWVRFVPQEKRRSLLQRGREELCDRIESARAAVFDRGRMDRALRLFYSQLPYHPQRIWAGTEMIADLQTAGATGVAARPAAPLASATEDLTGLHVHARLLHEVSSNTARRDDPVLATVTEPVYDAHGALVLPEGATLRGRVLQAQPSRSFGRNGQLRFVFMDVQRDGEQAQRAFGTVRAADGERAGNLSVDQEGGIKAQPDKNRFFAPVLLGALAVAGHDQDPDNGHNGKNVGAQVAAANGFGIIARVLALTVQNPDISSGFGAFGAAKSVAFHFFTPGQPVDFAKDTMVEVELQSR